MSSSEWTSLSNAELQSLFYEMVSEFNGCPDPQSSFIEYLTRLWYYLRDQRGIRMPDATEISPDRPWW
jgi:hypothetical protein